MAQINVQNGKALHEDGKTKARRTNLAKITEPTPERSNANAEAQGDENPEGHTQFSQGKFALL